MQIIQSGPTAATLRQKALDDSLNSALNSYASAEQTKRQQALQDQAIQKQQDSADLANTLKLTELGIASPLADVKAFAKGTYQQPVISPAVPAKPDQITEAPASAAAPAMSPADVRMQDESGGLQRNFQLGSEGKAAVMGPANPLQNYTEAKKAKMAADAFKIEADKKILQGKVAALPDEERKRQEEIKKLEIDNKYKPAEMEYKRTDSEFKRSQMQDKADSKDLEGFRKAHDPSIASARTPIGKEFSKYQQAQHALKLVDEFGDNLENVTPMKKRELAVTLATMLSPGLPHEDTIKHLDEPTLNSYLAEKIQLFTGKPAGTNSAEMVAQLKDSVMNQAELSQQNIIRYQKGVEASFASKIKKSPDAYNAIMEQTGIKGAPNFMKGHSEPTVTQEHLNTVKNMTREQKLALINGN